MSTLLPLAVGTANLRAPQSALPAEVQRKSSARQGRTRLRQFVRLGQPVQKKEPALQRAPKREDKFDFNLLRYPDA
ncbi:hypothetical protein DXA92_09690 [Agathobaculum butyriciproducens]|nr:hypothetical protein DXA92_09690 [Agathobaculum butyriciproducens]